jgi:hypothetical protein
MSWDKGFNFRASSNYVSDGANETYVQNTLDQYPTTRNGVTFGWTSTNGGLDGRDRSTSVDRRLAGMNFISGSTATTFQVDLPSSGQYNVSLAMGDDGFAQNTVKVVIKDGASALLTIGPHNTVAGSFYDATDSNIADTSWPANNSPATLTFTGTTLNLDLTGTVGVIAHLFVSQVSTGGGGGQPTRYRLRWRHG